VPDFFEIDRGQCLAIIRSRTRKAMALDDGARGFGGDAEALGNLGVRELLDRHDCPGGDLAVPAW
jgi:hypothetical protein